MDIYVLLKKELEGSKRVCISEDIGKIRQSICKDFKPDEDYPCLEIWSGGKKIDEVRGNAVLNRIANEIYRKEAASDGRKYES